MVLDFHVPPKACSVLRTTALQYSTKILFSALLPSKTGKGAQWH